MINEYKKGFLAGEEKNIRNVKNIISELIIREQGERNKLTGRLSKSGVPRRQAKLSILRELLSKIKTPSDMPEERVELIPRKPANLEDIQEEEQMEIRRLNIEEFKRLIPSSSNFSEDLILNLCLTNDLDRIRKLSKIEDKKEGCGKYIKSQDRICGQFYGNNGKKDLKNFVKLNKKKDWGMFLCPCCKKEKGKEGGEK
jgi:hypothetical protein